MASKQPQTPRITKMNTPSTIPSSKYGPQEEKFSFIQENRHRFTTKIVRQLFSVSCVRCESPYSLKQMPFRLKCAVKCKIANYQECGGVLCKNCWLAQNRGQCADLVSFIKLCKGCSKINFKKLICESSSSLLFGGRNSKEHFHIVADFSVLQSASLKDQDISSRHPASSMTLSAGSQTTTTDAIKSVCRKSSMKLRQRSIICQSFSSDGSLEKYIDLRITDREKPELLHPYQLSGFDQIRYMLIEIPDQAQNLQITGISQNTYFEDSKGYQQITRVKCFHCHEYYNNLNPKIQFGQDFGLCVFCVLNESIQVHNLGTEQETIMFQLPVFDSELRAFRRFYCGQRQLHFSRKHFFLHIIKHAKSLNLPHPITCCWTKQDEVEGRVMGGGHFLSLERSNYFEQNHEFDSESKLAVYPEKHRKYLQSKRAILAKVNKCVFCGCNLDITGKKVSIILPASLLHASCQACLLSRLSEDRILHKQNQKIVFEITNPVDNLPSRILFDMSLPNEKDCKHGTRLFYELMQFLPVTQDDLICEHCYQLINQEERYPFKSCSRGHVICIQCAALYIETIVNTEHRKNQILIKLSCPADDCPQKSRALYQHEIDLITDKGSAQDLVETFYQKHEEILKKREQFYATHKKGIQDKTHPQFEGIN